MKLLYLTVSIFPLLACACAVASAQDPTGGQVAAEASTALPPTEEPSPMANFARLVSGEWRRPALTQVDMFDTWHWGPGKHSMLSQTYGSDADDKPWRALQVFYWHPGRKQVCLLGLDPFASGVSQGTIRFDGETADAVLDLYQTGQHRNISFRWRFDGPDRYHSTLLEDAGSGFQPLVEWDYVRFEAGSSELPSTSPKDPQPTRRFRPFEPLLVGTWAAKASWAKADAIHIQTEFEWIPYADAIYVRVTIPAGEGESVHLLDAYLYQHTGTGKLRCLALSNEGGVYEGDLTVSDGGALQLDLEGNEGDRVVQYAARFEFESGGTLRQQVWSLEGASRTVVLDTQHKQLDSEQD